MIQCLSLCRQSQGTTLWLFAVNTAKANEFPPENEITALLKRCWPMAGVHGYSHKSMVLRLPLQFGPAERASLVRKIEELMQQRVEI